MCDSINRLYLCDTPDGADWTSCPLCNGYRTTLPLCYNYNKGDIEQASFIRDDSKQCDLSDDEEFNDNMQESSYIYCIKCKVLFQIGDYYMERGCTDSTYHALMIYKYQINGHVVDGIPTFESYEKCKYLLKHQLIR